MTATRTQPSPQPGIGKHAGFSTVLRERSRDVHEQAEHSGFVSALIAGRISRDGYGTMVAQHLHIYDALESVGHQLRGKSVADAFLCHDLVRVPSIRADLAHLYGPATEHWPGPLPATRRYAERIRDTATWPAGFVAHHYTRYLGDLSGGLAIGAVVARVYGFQPGGDGVRFYRFAGIDKPKAFKDDYRTRLDAAPWSAADRERMVEEVRVAYRLNTDVLAELLHACPPTR